MVVSGRALVLTVLITLAVCLAGAVYPALRAGLLRPVQVLRQA